MPPDMERRALAETSLYNFGNIYFREYMTSPSGELHESLCDEIEHALLPGNRLIGVTPKEHAKCQSGDAVVQMADGSHRPLRDVRVGDMVVGLDGWKLRPATVKWSGPTGKKPMLKITTESGNVMKVSPVHRLRAFGGFLDAGSLEVGNSLASPRFIPQPAETYRLPDADVAILAYWIAEGSRGQWSLLITNHDPAVLTDIEAWCSTLGFTSRRLQDRRRYPDGRDVGIRVHKGGRTMIRKYGMDPLVCGSYDKFVPSQIMRAPDDQVALFLNRLFECDGHCCLNRGRPVIGYTSASRRLVDGIRSLLLRFGIICRVSIGHVQGKPFHTLTISSGRDIVKFKQYIGFFRKQIPEYEYESQYPRHDCIPQEWKTLRTSTINDHNLRKQGIFLGTKGAHSIEKVRSVAVLEDNQALFDVVEADVWWDKIKSIETIPDEMTYDISVEHSENYVSDGVVSHNTSWGTNITPVYVMAKKLKHFIRIWCDTREKAADKLADVFAFLLEPNHPLIEDYGDDLRPVEGFNGRTMKFTGNEAILPNIKIQALHFGAKARGMKFRNWRPDLDILDDPEDEAEVEIDRWRREKKSWYNRQLLGGVAADESLIHLGTIVHSDGILPWLFDPKNGKKDWRRWDKYKDIYKIAPCPDYPLGVTIWPEHWSPERAAAKREEIGTLAFNQEYRNMPIDPEAQRYKLEDARYYNPDPHSDDLRFEHGFWTIRVPARIQQQFGLSGQERRPLQVVAGIDLAMGEENQHAFTVYMAGGTMWVPGLARPLIFILHIERARITPLEQLQRQTEFYDRWKPTRIGMDSQVFQEVVKLQAQQAGLPVTGLPSQARKNQRIDLASVVWEQNLVYLPVPSSRNWVEPFIDEAVTYPKGAFKDQLDAFANMQIISDGPSMGGTNQFHSGKKKLTLRTMTTEMR